MPVESALVLGLELALLAVECVDLVFDGNVVHHLLPDLETFSTMRTLKGSVYLVDMPF